MAKLSIYKYDFVFYADLRIQHINYKKMKQDSKADIGAKIERATLPITYVPECF
jgi:hypothetical protein